MRSRYTSRGQWTDPAMELPISALNTTPLIDVMLVLLIMFIVTIPIATHGIKMDLPRGDPGGPEPISHSLDLDRAGRLAFDGVATSASELGPRLLEAFGRNPLAELHFRSDGEARYEDFDRTLAIVKRSGVERIGFVGNERFAGALPH
jgi:biopolymer transport protein ExbD